MIDKIRTKDENKEFEPKGILNRLSINLDEYLSKNRNTKSAFYSTFSDNNKKCGIAEGVKAEIEKALKNDGPSDEQRVILTAYLKKTLKDNEGLLKGFISDDKIYKDVKIALEHISLWEIDNVPGYAEKVKPK